MKEEPKQSIESQLQMVRPRRAEVKRVPLTPEEKEFLGEIMDKAVAAEKAGDLAKALGFYTDYRDELLKIKRKKEKNNIVWTKEKLEKWAADNGIDEERFVETSFDLSKLPKLETKESLYMEGEIIDEFPANMVIHRDLVLRQSEVKKWIGTGLTIKADCYMAGAKFDYLPENTRILRALVLNKSTIKDLPDDLFVGGDIYVVDCSEIVKEKAKKLKIEGKIKGDIILKYLI